MMSHPILIFICITGLACCASTAEAQRTIDPGQPALAIGSIDDDSASALFGIASVTRLSDGRLVVANSGTLDLRVFAADGRHIRNIGRQGQGPGEFASLQLAGLMRGDTIVAYDVWLGRITRFTADGKVVGTDQLQPFGNGVLPRAVGFLDDGRMVGRTDFSRVFGRGERRDTITFVLHMRDGVPRDTLGVYPGEEEFHLAEPDFAMRRPVMFGRNTHASVAGRYIVIASNDSFSIDIFVGERRLRTYSRQHQHMRVDPRDVRMLRDEIVRNAREQIRAFVRRRIDEFPARETLPAFDGLLVGRDGSLWIRLAGSPRAVQQTWEVFAQNATVPVAVTFPVSFRLLEAGHGYALGSYRDELGVEYVHLYRLTGIE